LKQLERNEVI